ncbi:MAG TPA: Gfo/Idh/MocA family oxidoreductase [Gaiellaceae bacterium]|nr:Gfo/Idh/MocA family oxidoreductase [Gaiellaceae bacterium]
MTVAWGLLSTAPINRSIISAARETDAAEVIAVASRDAARAEAYAAEHGIERGYGGYDALLGDADVEAVYVSLPNGLHVEWTMRALEAGKHVLCEKPFSRRAADVEAAFDLADRGGLVLSEGFMWRHHPQTATLARLLADGAVGRLRLVRAAFSFPLATERSPEDARFDPELDGGAMMDVGCYCVNAIRFLAGEPLSASARQFVGPTGVDVVFAAVMTHADDVVSHFDCGFVVPRRSELEVLGEEGRLFVLNPFVIREPGFELRRDGEVEHIAVDHVDSYRLELENVSGAIRGESELLLGREDAVAQAHAIESLYRSAA